jgi:cell fate regulator YaaT (PSP1 superfamily)
MNNSKVLVKLLNCRRKRDYFTVATDETVKRGDLCVVERGYGQELGIIIKDPEIEDTNNLSSPSHKVVRKTTIYDKEKMEKLCKEEAKALKKAKRLIRKYQLPMNPVAAEFTLYKSTFFLYFTSPRRVDFRGLIRELASEFGSRIELRHIGPREEAQIEGGLGRCGRPLCCVKFLESPKSISISLVHDQELFVSPERVTGICGRLFCCLEYEHQNYVQIISQMPRIGAQIRYKGNEYEVVGHNIFKKAVILEEHDGTRKEIPFREIKD